MQMNEFPEGTLSLPHIGSGTSDSTYWGIVHFAHCQKLLTGRGFLSGTVLQAKIQNTEQEKTEIE